MMSQPFRLNRRFQRWLVFLVLVYPAYFLLLGPFWALDGRFGIVPDRVRGIIWTPTMWCRDVPVMFQVMDAYLDCWYTDPQAPETTR